MIPAQNVVAWGNVVPWADQRQIEQDLITGRAVVEIFSGEMLRDALRLRGGTALNKLHFQVPPRYSEDIGLVRTSAGPIGPILDRLRVVLEPWLGTGTVRFRALSHQSCASAPRPRMAAVCRSGSRLRSWTGARVRSCSPWTAARRCVPRG